MAEWSRRRDAARRVLWDAFETIILPRRVSGRIRLTKLFYRPLDSLARCRAALAGGGVTRSLLLRTSH